MTTVGKTTTAKKGRKAKLPPGIDLRPNGRFQVRWRDPSGDQRARTFRELKDAEIFNHQLRAALHSDSYADDRGGRISLGEYAEEVISGREKAANPWTSRTANLYRYTMATVPAELLARPIGKLTEAMLAEWLGQLVRPVEQGGRGLAHSTARAHLARLRTILGVAVRRRLIPFNPASGEDVDLGKRAEHEVHSDEIPSGAEVAALIQAMPERFRVAVVLGALVGLRSGEVRGLRRMDVNPLRGEIRVEQQLVRVRGNGGPEVPGKPKTDTSRRVIPVDPATMAALTEHIARFRAGAAPEDYVLVTVNGGLLDANSLGHWWRRACAAAGVNYRFHDLRHHYASVLLLGGLDRLAVARRLGHANAALIDNTYGHLIGDHAERTRAAISAHSASVLSGPGLLAVAGG